MRISGLSHVGHIRQRNEDAIGWSETTGVALLADGMGGHPGGDVASAIAVETGLAETAGDGPWLGRAGQPTALVDRIQRAMLDHTATHPALRDMATTLVMLAADPPDALILHVGDSRAYRYRNGALTRLTRDHNAAQEAVDRQLMTPAEARQSPERHLVTRAMGLDEWPQPDVQQTDVRRGDVFLLCSDGLTGELPDREIEQMLADHLRDPDEASRMLVRAALDRGGRDNVSVIVARF